MTMDATLARLEAKLDRIIEMLGARPAKPAPRRNRRGPPSVLDDPDVFSRAVAMRRGGIAVMRIAHEIGAAASTLAERFKAMPELREIRATKHKGPPDRLRQIIELREAGATMPEIGARFGLAGERVRQILSRAGRKDLLGSNSSGYIGAPGYNPPAGRSCPQCGAVKSAEAVLCLGCRKHKTRERYAELARQMAPLRAAGASWKEVADRLEVIGASNAHTIARAALHLLTEDERAQLRLGVRRQINGISPTADFVDSLAEDRS